MRAFPQIAALLLVLAAPALAQEPPAAPDECVDEKALREALRAAAAEFGFRPTKRTATYDAAADTFQVSKPEPVEIADVLALTEEWEAFLERLIAEAERVWESKALRAMLFNHYDGAIFFRTYTVTSVTPTAKGAHVAIAREDDGRSRFVVSGGDSHTFVTATPPAVGDRLRIPCVVRLGEDFLRRHEPERHGFNFDPILPRARR